MKINYSWVLIPIKSAAEAKTRLAGRLNPAQRTKLQHAMLQDLLEGLSSSRLLSGVLLYGPDPAPVPESIKFRLDYLRQPDRVHGLNAAVAHGVQDLVHRGAETIAVLPGDLPLADGVDLDRALLDVALGHHCVVVPDRRHARTHGLVFPAGVRPRFSFGRQSFRRHLSETDKNAACPRKALELASFADDIDTCEDLVIFQRKQRGLRGRRTRAVIDAAVATQMEVAISDEIRL